MALFTPVCRKCGKALVVRASAFGTRVGCGCRALLAVVNDNTPQPPAAPAAHVAAVQVEVGTPVLALAA